MSTIPQTNIFESKNAEQAEMRVIQEFRKFAGKVRQIEVNDFFDPRNRDLWLKEFARHLESLIDQDFPSND